MSCDYKFEVCISDNCSTENVEKIISLYENKINIKFKKNKRNIGLGKNIIESVSMAEGDYVWIIGNDDLFLPNTLKKISEIIKNNKEADYFYINSFELESEKIFNKPQPFDTKNLPNHMEKFSKQNKNRSLYFFDIIKPSMAWDFCLGMFRSVFKKEKWIENLNVIDQDLINDTNLYSNFDNTCPHIKIFSNAFCKSKAYFQADPLIVALKGEREWENLYSFVEIIRIPEVLDLYKKKGLPLFQFLHCKNYALRNFASYIVKIIFYKGETGLKYINFKKHILSNLIFPNLYLSFFYFIFRKIFKFSGLKVK